MNKPDKTPYCWNCSQEPEWVIMSVNIGYFYCKSCKQEIKQGSSSAPELDMDNEGRTGPLKFSGGGWGLKSEQNFVNIVNQVAEELCSDFKEQNQYDFILDCWIQSEAKKYDMFSDTETTHDPDYMSDADYAAYYGWGTK